MCAELGRWLDVIDIGLPDGRALDLRFDITEFCGLYGSESSAGETGNDDDPMIGEQMANKRE